MIKNLISISLVFYIFFGLSIQVYSDTELDIYMNDFYSKTNEAKKILKGIEKDLKEGNNAKSCFMQRKAAKLGLLANKSLMKAFEIEGLEPPIKVIESSQKRWEYLLNECKK